MTLIFFVESLGVKIFLLVFLVHIPILKLVVRGWVLGSEVISQGSLLRLNYYVLLTYLIGKIDFFLWHFLNLFLIRASLLSKYRLEVFLLSFTAIVCKSEHSTFAVSLRFFSRIYGDTWQLDNDCDRLWLFGFINLFYRDIVTCNISLRLNPATASFMRGFLICQLFFSLLIIIIIIFIIVIIIIVVIIVIIIIIIII